MKGEGRSKRKPDGWIWRRSRTSWFGKRDRRRKRLAVENESVSKDEVRSWCSTDEAAVDAIAGWSDSKSRRKCGGFFRHPPLVGFPPLDRAVLRPGHVLEIVGSSGSGKTEILIQAAVSSILPTKFKEVSYGGSQGPVLLFDLDGRFDMHRLVIVLRSRIDEAHSTDAAAGCSEEMKNEVLVTSLGRFYRIQCFKSFEFLSALKTLHLQTNRIAQEHHGKAVQLVLIDGIGSYYWLDWLSSCAAGYTTRRTLGVQRFSELIVQELRRLRNAKLFLVLATKALLYPPPKKRRSNGSSTSRFHHREYMPAAWQKFVTHRVLLQQPLASGPRVFTAQWDKPSLTEQDEFVIEDQGLMVLGRKKGSMLDTVSEET